MKDRVSQLLVLLLVFLCAATAFAQDPPRISEEVTVTADDPIYKSLRLLSSTPGAFGGEYIKVNNTTFKKDVGSFTLRSGEIYLLKNSDGRYFGGVFLGDGEFNLTPPDLTEQKHIAIFTGEGKVSENFDTLTMFFTDKTGEELKALPNVEIASSGSQQSKALSEFRNRESTLRRSFRFNIHSRMLSDIYAPEREGFFTVFIDGKKFGKLSYSIDPLGNARTYPEQVELMSYGESTGGIWASFHKEAEYAKGTATSWTDRRSYDIKHHEMDVSISGTRLTVKDTVTIEMREKNVRYLPFDLFGSLRVSAVKDETENAVTFIQEKKDEDSDLGVILPTAVEPGKPFKLTFEYDGVDALHEAGAGNYILIPRSTWYPNNPNTSFGDRATFTVSFSYPKKFTLIGIGDRVGEEQKLDKVKTSKWTSGNTELAVAGFNYGDFKKKLVKDESTNLELEVFTNNVLPDEIRALQSRIEQAERAGVQTMTTLGSLNTSGMASTVLTEAQNSTRIYTAFFGKLPYSRVAMTQQPAGFFGQAWPTLIFMPYTAFFGDTHRVQLFGIKGGTDGFWREVAAHEVAHQWWGHMVGWTSYRDQWMSEGFSEFSTSLYIQYVKKDPGKFAEFWEDQRRQIMTASPRTMGKKPYTVGPVTQGYRLNSAKTGAIAQSMIYPKGAYILQMIRMMMYDHRGNTRDERFQLMMRDFLKDNYNKDISTNDFKKAVEKHITPAMDIDKNGKMDWFFDQWVYGTEVPSYSLEYSTNESGGKISMSLKITQSGVSDKFVMPVPIYLELGSGWTYLGTATLVGNTSAEVKDVGLPSLPKKVTVAALHDVLINDLDVKKK